MEERTWDEHKFLCDAYNSQSNQPTNAKSSTELVRNSYILFTLTNGIDRKTSLHLMHINEGKRLNVKLYLVKVTEAKSSLKHDASYCWLLPVWQKGGL